MNEKTTRWRFVLIVEDLTPQLRRTISIFLIFDKMLEILESHACYYFLDGPCYNYIEMPPEDQEKDYIHLSICSIFLHEDTLQLMH